MNQLKKHQIQTSPPRAFYGTLLAQSEQPEYAGQVQRRLALYWTVDAKYLCEIKTYDPKTGALISHHASEVKTKSGVLNTFGYYDDAKVIYEQCEIEADCNIDCPTDSPLPELRLISTDSPTLVFRGERIAHLVDESMPAIGDPSVSQEYELYKTHQGQLVGRKTSYEISSDDYELHCNRQLKILSSRNDTVDFFNYNVAQQLWRAARA